MNKHKHDKRKKRISFNKIKGCFFLNVLLGAKDCKRMLGELLQMCPNQTLKYKKKQNKRYSLYTSWYLEILEPLKNLEKSINRNTDKNMPVWISLIRFSTRIFKPWNILDYEKNLKFNDRENMVFIINRTNGIECLWEKKQFDAEHIFFGSA